MTKRSRQGSLTSYEKTIVKALLGRGWRNQDIQALVNIGRKATINSGRITGVKQDNAQKKASKEETDFYIEKKNSFDPSTGLNLYDDERLIRSREAMILAVQTFNSPGLRFKTEVFSVLANIAWTYLLHEHYLRKKVKIVKDTGFTISLSEMIEREDCPLSLGTKNNLKALKQIRDEVEHNLLGRIDVQWAPLYQACCLNYDQAITEIFGARVSLQKELNLALQFAKLDFDNLVELHKQEVPPNIRALDARLDEQFSEEEKRDLNYQFRVVYTLDKTSKGKAHIRFVNPESEEGEQIRNVLVDYRPADHLFPYKPGKVAKEVSRRSKQEFTSHNHIQAWKYYDVRPKSNAMQPENTNKDYCIYHPAHSDYTYSEAWIEFLIEKIKDPEEFRKIKSVKR